MYCYQNWNNFWFARNSFLFFLSKRIWTFFNCFRQKLGSTQTMYQRCKTYRRPKRAIHHNSHKKKRFFFSRYNIHSFSFAFCYVYDYITGQTMQIPLFSFALFDFSFNWKLKNIFLFYWSFVWFFFFNLQVNFLCGYSLLFINVGFYQFLLMFHVYNIYLTASSALVPFCTTWYYCNFSVCCFRMYFLY